jgi:cell division protein FtsA
MSGYIVGLDIGTTKICAIVAKADRAGEEIIAMGSSQSNGLRKGVVVDMDATVESIKKAVAEAEENSGIDIKVVYAGIAGGHIRCQGSFGATGIKGGEVREADIERVIEAASTLYVPLDREMLHVVPSEFLIDGQDGIMRPLGMSGVRLEVKVNIITAAHANMENIVKCCGRAGIKIADIVLEPLASARAVLRYDEMEQGALLIDIGGGTTDIALFKNGALKYASVLPIGGAHFTNDISIGLKIPYNEAERLKKQYSSAFAGESLEARSLNGEARQVQSKHMAEIIRPRCEELCEMIKNNVKDAVLSHTPLCAALTGGTSLLRGIGKVAEAYLGVPVRTGFPERAKSSILKDISKSPVYSTGVGLVLYGYDREWADRAGEDILSAVLEGAGRFAKGMFRVQGFGFGLRKLISRVHGPES